MATSISLEWEFNYDSDDTFCRNVVERKDVLTDIVERKDVSTDIVEAVVSQLLDDAWNESSFVTEKESNEVVSYNEDDIEKRIKDLRRLYESRNYCESRSDSSTVSNVLSNSLIKDVDNSCVDACDRHWKRICESQKRKRTTSPNYFGNIDISPVKKVIKNISPSNSPKFSSSVPCSTPWTPTETTPTIFWSDVKPCTVTVDKEYSSYSHVGSDDNPEEEVDMSNKSNVEVPDDKCDLRKILDLKRSSKEPNKWISSNYNKDTRVNDKIRVTVKDPGTSGLGGNSYKDNENNREIITYEELDIFENGSELNEQTDSLKLKQSGYSRNDLIRKKNVLERLIGMVEKGDSILGDRSANGGVNDFPLNRRYKIREDDDSIAANNVTTYRKVVFRGSSPDPASREVESKRTVLDDFNTEMEKRMRDLFPMQQEMKEVSIKVEPVSEDEEMHDVVENKSLPIINGIKLEKKEEFSRIHVENLEVGKKKKNLTSCNWENHPQGCKRLDCPFLHQVPTDLGSSPLPCNQTQTSPTKPPKLHADSIIVNSAKSLSPPNFKYECTICNVKVVNKYNMEQHRRGKRHQLNIKSERQFVRSSPFGNVKHGDSVGKHIKLMSSTYRSNSNYVKAVDESANFNGSDGLHGNFKNKTKDSHYSDAVGRNIVRISCDVKDGSANNIVKGGCGNRETKKSEKPPRKKIVWDLK